MSLYNRTRFDHPTVPLLITAMTYAAFILFRLSLFSFDPSGFITAGETLVNPASLKTPIIVLENSPGYDGQFYYRLALDPFTSKVEDFGIRIDIPPYRHQRILYPFLVWLVSAGHAIWAPSLMIILNFGCLCLTGWLGGMYAQTLNRHALWGLFFSLYPGFLLSLSRNLTEILEICLLLAGLLFIRKGRQLLAAILLTFAILAKETALLATGGLFVSWLVSSLAGKEKGRIEWYLFSIPALSFLFWQGILYFHWGQLPALSGAGQIGFPFEGITRFVLANVPFRSLSQAFLLGEFLFVVLFTAGAMVSFVSSSAAGHEKYGWIAYGALMALLTNAIWVEDWAFLRALSDFYLLGVIIILGSGLWIRKLVFSSSMVIWGFLFLRGIFYA